MDENEIHNTVSIDRVALVPYHMQSSDELTETAIRRTQIVAELKTEPTKMTLA